jgi:hypothetical protein
LSRLQRLRARIAALPVLAFVAGCLVVLGAAIAGGISAYRAYTFVEHDNEFCLSCHLMQEPFERFARSAHRGLGCKACHQPTLVERSRMGLAQFIDDPETIRVHAHVPDDVCAACHVRGDPERWLRIAASAGHRVHLESQDTALAGLQCVTCHSSSVHEFAATDRTCAQAGCHEAVEVRLGRMGQLTIHCASCHAFSTPVPDTVADVALAAVLSPRRDECLSCHAMRAMLPAFPADEPHGAACGLCHDPHQQETPRDAVATCAGSGCHTAADTLSPFHRGLRTGVLENCSACHPAHSFRVRGDDCLACHTDIFRVSAGPQPAGPARGVGLVADRPGARQRSASAALRAPRTTPAMAPRPAEPDRSARAARAAIDTVRFRHSTHRTLECARCHESSQSHGRLTVVTIRDCRSCHHAEPVVEPCVRCHADLTALGRRAVRQSMRLAAGAHPRSRDLPYDHAPHAAIACATCHAATVDREARSVDCVQCHADHHVERADCMTCHRTPAAGVHTLATHVTCTGAGCHDRLPLRVPPAGRTVCLACHQTLTGHYPPRACIDCHAIAAPGGA